MQMLLGEHEAKEPGSAGEKGPWGPKVGRSKGPFLEPNGCEANAGVSQPGCASRRLITFLMQAPSYRLH